MFYVGQKVVCVKSSPWKHPSFRYFDHLPILNRIYIIRGCVVAYNAPYVYLEEIRNTPHNWSEIGFAEPAFWSGHFRPIIEKKTDISIFTALLPPSEVKQREKV